jgi:hypothetical protein
VNPPVEGRDVQDAAVVPEPEGWPSVIYRPDGHTPGMAEGIDQHSLL